MHSKPVPIPPPTYQPPPQTRPVSAYPQPQPQPPHQVATTLIQKDPYISRKNEQNAPISAQNVKIV